MPIKDNHTTKSALILASLICEWEAENSADNRQWSKECLEVADILRRLNDAPKPEWVQRKPPQNNHMSEYVQIA